MRAVRGIIAVSISLIALAVWAVVTNPIHDFTRHAQTCIRDLTTWAA